MNPYQPFEDPGLEGQEILLSDALEILDFASAASSPRELCQGVAELVCRQLGGQQAVIAMQNQLDYSPAFMLYNGEHSFAEKYVEYYHDHDPFDITQYLRGARGLYSFSRYLGKKSNCDFVDYNDIMRTEYYSDFCIPQKVHYSLVTRMHGGASFRATLCVHQGKDDAPFSPGAVKMMEAISPHLSSNLRRTVDEFVVSALDSDDQTALIILDDNRRLLYCNPLAQSFVRALRSDAEPAGPSGPDILLSLAEAQGETTIETAEGPYLVDARNDCSPNSNGARVIKIRRNSDFASLYGEKLRSRFGFSERETEVLAAVINGQRNKEIARRLCVSEHTVKKHIQSMARKADVAGRTALVHAALQQLHLIS